MLDYGSGWGGFTEMLCFNGFEAQGVELSQEMVEYPQKRGLPIQQGDITTEKGSPLYGAIVLRTVFENLVEHDDWISQASRLPKCGGLFVTLQPTVQFANFMGRIVRMGNLSARLPALLQVSCPPWHTVLFSLRGM